MPNSFAGCISTWPAAFRPPTTTRKFLSDTDARNAPRTIDSLLASDVFPRRMREVVTVWLLERRPGTVVADPDWNKFVETAFAANQPWDAFVRELISADGSDPKTRAAIRFFVDGGRNSHHQMTQDVARLFLGMNLQCAQCHNDPNVRDFEQAHYFGLFAYLQQSKLQSRQEAAIVPDRDRRQGEDGVSIRFQQPETHHGAKAAGPCRDRCARLQEGGGVRETG